MPRNNTDRHPIRSIVRLGLPILIGQIGMIVTGFADTMMVGRYSTAALASASFVNNVFTTAIFACLGMTFGVTPLVGALYARRDSATIGAMVRTALRVNVAFAVVVTAVMGVVYALLPQMGQPEELLPIIRPYFLVFLGSILPIAAFNVFAQWSYAINDTRMPMWIMLFVNGLNVLGNWLLIYGPGPFPEMGLKGAGVSTFLTRWLALGLILLEFFRGRRGCPYVGGYRLRQPGRAMAGRVWKTSYPVSLQMTFESCAFSMSAIMTGWLGALPLAALQVIIVIGTLGFSIYHSVGSAVAVLVSNAAGADDARAMRSMAFWGYGVTLMLAAAASLAFWLGGHNFIALFTEDEAVISLALTLIVPLILYQACDATQINFSGALRGTSHVMPMLWIAFVSYILIQIPATWLLGFTAGLGVYGVVLSYSVSLFVAGLLFLLFFLRHSRPTAV